MKRVARLSTKFRIHKITCIAIAFWSLTHWRYHKRNVD